MAVEPVAPVIVRGGGVSLAAPEDGRPPIPRSCDLCERPSTDGEHVCIGCGMCFCAMCVQRGKRIGRDCRCDSDTFVAQQDAEVVERRSESDDGLADCDACGERGRGERCLVCKTEFCEGCLSDGRRLGPVAPCDCRWRQQVESDPVSVLRDLLEGTDHHGGVLGDGVHLADPTDPESRFQIHLEPVAGG